jgi:hypothetical protein
MTSSKSTSPLEGITIVVNGDKLGTCKSWTAVDESGPLPKGCGSLLVSRHTQVGEEVSVPIDALSEWWRTSIPTGKSTLGLTALGKLLAPGPLYIKAQLEMWGVDDGGEVCESCWSELVTTMEAGGYCLWFEDESDVTEFAEDIGVSSMKKYRVTVSWSEE